MLPMPGLLASLARGEGPVCQASLWDRTNWAMLEPEARGEREYVGEDACLGFSFIYTASNLPPGHLPRKKPFSVEVNGPAQINGSVWVSPQRAPGRPLLAPPCLQPHTGQLHKPPCFLPRLFLRPKRLQQTPRCAHSQRRSPTPSENAGRPGTMRHHPNAPPWTEKWLAGLTYGKYPTSFFCGTDT